MRQQQKANKPKFYRRTAIELFDGVYLDDLCYAVIMNDPNYCAMSLTASEPYHQDTQRDLKPPD